MADQPTDPLIIFEPAISLPLLKQHKPEPGAKVIVVKQTISDILRKGESAPDFVEKSSDDR